MPITSDARAASREPRGADPMADHKRRARWRLFGSFILIGAVALIAPVFLEDEARNLSDDLLIDMPAKAVSTKPDEPAQDAPATDLADTDAKKDPVRQEELKKDPSKQTELKKDLSKLSSEPSTKEPTDQIRRQSDPRQADLTAAAAVFYVQVGAYGSLEAAGGIKKQLESLGHSVLIQPVKVAGGADRFRVRVGPMKSRPQAEEVMDRVKRSGFEAVIVNPVQANGQ